MQGPGHAEALGDQLEAAAQVVDPRHVAVGPEHGAHVELVGQPVIEMAALDDRGVVVGQEAGHGGDHALTIGALQDQDIALGGGLGVHGRVVVDLGRTAKPHCSDRAFTKGRVKENGPRPPTRSRPAPSRRRG
jgi:hypothetical protein